MKNVWRSLITGGWLNILGKVHTSISNIQHGLNYVRIGIVEIYNGITIDMVKQLKYIQPDGKRIISFSKKRLYIINDSWRICFCEYCNKQSKHMFLLNNSLFVNQPTNNSNALQVLKEIRRCVRIHEGSEDQKLTYKKHSQWTESQQTCDYCTKEMTKHVSLYTSHTWNTQTSRGTL